MLQRCYKMSKLIARLFAKGSHDDEIDFLIQWDERGLRWCTDMSFAWKGFVGIVVIYLSVMIDANFDQVMDV